MRGKHLSHSFFVCATPGIIQGSVPPRLSTQKSLPALCSGVTLGSVQGTLRDDRDLIWISCVPGKRLFPLGYNTRVPRILFGIELGTEPASSLPLRCIPRERGARCAPGWGEGPDSTAPRKHSGSFLGRCLQLPPALAAPPGRCSPQALSELPPPELGDGAFATRAGVGAGGGPPVPWGGRGGPAGPGSGGLGSAAGASPRQGRSAAREAGPGPRGVWKPPGEEGRRSRRGDSGSEPGPAPRDPGAGPALPRGGHRPARPARPGPAAPAAVPPRPPSPSPSFPPPGAGPGERSAQAPAPRPRPRPRAGARRPIRRPAPGPARRSSGASCAGARRAGGRRAGRWLGRWRRGPWRPRRVGPGQAVRRGPGRGPGHERAALASPRLSPWRGSRTTSCWWRSGRTRAVSGGRAGPGRAGRAGQGRAGAPGPGPGPARRCPARWASRPGPGPDPRPAPGRSPSSGGPAGARRGRPEKGERVGSGWGPPLAERADRAEVPRCARRGLGPLLARSLHRRGWGQPVARGQLGGGARGGEPGMTAGRRVLVPGDGREVARLV